MGTPEDAAGLGSRLHASGEAARALVSAAEVQVGADRRLTERLSGLEADAPLVLFVAEGCPHCASAVREAVRLVAASRRVSLEVVDVGAAPELVARHGVRSVPLLLLADGRVFVGVSPAAELASALVDRGSPEQEARALLGQLRAGRLEAASARLAEARARRGFLLAWDRSTLSDRIGLMLAAERALEANATGLDGMVAELGAILGGSEDSALRGDSADLLGRIGSPEALAVLERLLGDGDPEVVEAAAEAIEAIGAARGGPGDN